MYQSDATRFLRELLEANPQLVELQKRNRATWWDRPQDRDALAEREAASVPVPPYAYFPLPRR